MTHIEGKLWIGNWQNAKEHARLPRTITVTVANDSPFHGDKVFNLVDGPGNDEAEWRRAAAEVVALVNNNAWDRVHVHCVSGRSRSASVIVGALIVDRSWDYCKAYDHIISQHDRTRIHPALAEFIIKAHQR